MKPLKTSNQAIEKPGRRSARSWAASCLLKTMTLGMLGASLLSTGCGKQEYIASNLESAQTAPGTYVIPPKVDILLVEDDTGGISEAFSEVKRGMEGFLVNLEAKGWDYHFATTPMLKRYSDSAQLQVMASRHDLNWGNLWRAPWPGATEDAMTGVVAEEAFRTPSLYSQFVSRPTQSDGYEPSFETIWDLFQRKEPGTNFLRDDAMLAIIVVGNGNDTSGLTYCLADGTVVPRGTNGSRVCEEIGWGVKGSGQSTLEEYENNFLSLKNGNYEQIRFYASVANATRSASQCRGGNSTDGYRYRYMTQAFGGRSFDICTQPISSVLTSLATQLQAERRSFRTRYLFMAHEPEPATIEVVRYVGGNAHLAEVIPHDPTHTNGWDYVGYLQGDYVIDAPVEMNWASGWAVRLYGNARLVGDDTAKVNYKLKGAQDSVTD